VFKIIDKQSGQIEILSVQDALNIFKAEKEEK
jgi:hypothetical protein